MATRKAPPTTATSPAPAIIRCSCSISSANWNAARCVQATSIQRTVGRTCWNRSWPCIGASSSAVFRADAAFANPEVYEFQEAEHYKYAIRLPANQILQQRIGYLLKRPVGRPPSEVRRYYANFSYQAQSWK